MNARSQGTWVTELHEDSKETGQHGSASCACMESVILEVPLENATDS
jgi:hypothetical protein